MNTRENDYVQRELEKINKAKNDELNRMIDELESFKVTSNDRILDESDKLNEINRLSAFTELLDKMKNMVGEKMVAIGRSMGSKSSLDDVELDEALEEIDLELKEEDVKPLALVNYLANTPIYSTISNTLRKGDITLMAVESLKEDSNAQKYALASSLAFASLLHKNEKNPKVAKILINFENKDISQIMAQKLIVKYREYEQLKLANFKIALGVVGLENLNLGVAKEKIERYAESLHSNLFPTIGENGLEDFHVNRTSKSSDEIRIDLINSWKDLGLVDPDGSLREELISSSNRSFIDTEAKNKRRGGYVMK